MNDEASRLIDGGDYYYYLPEGYNENTAVNFYVCTDYNGEGAQRVKDGILGYPDQTKTGYPNDSIIVIPKINYPFGGDQYDVYIAAINKFYDDVKTKTGKSLNKTNVSVSGWSESANNALIVAQHSQSLGNIKVNNIIVIDGPYSGENTTKSGKEFMKTLGAAGGSMIVVSAWPERTSTWSERAAELAQAGGSAIRVTLTDGADLGHAWANTLTYRCNIAGLYSGGLIVPDYNTGKDRIKYTIEMFDIKTNNWVELTPEELQEKIKSGEIDISSVEAAIDQTFDQITIDTVKSDNDVLQGYIDKMHRDIESSNIYGTTAKGYLSTTINPNNQNTIIGNFFRSTMELHQKLASDTNYVLTVGSKLQEMDKNLSERAKGLAEPPALPGGNPGGDPEETATKKHTFGELALNVGGYGASGAIIGTAINPGLGTVIGFGIGAVVGVAATYWQEIVGFFKGLGTKKDSDSEVQSTPAPGPTPSTTPAPTPTAAPEPTIAPGPTPVPDVLGTE